MVHFHPTLRQRRLHFAIAHHLLQITIAERIETVPANAREDDLRQKVTPCMLGDLEVIGVGIQRIYLSKEIFLAYYSSRFCNTTPFFDTLPAILIQPLTFVWKIYSVNQRKLERTYPLVERLSIIGGRV